MLYKSTRSIAAATLDSAVVIKNGLAPDGGLYVPENIPAISIEDIKELCKQDYPHRVAFTLSKYLTDYSYNELLDYANKAYCEESFPGGATQIRSLNNGFHILELWHGPTAAFKDMALQIMPRLLSGALKKTGEKSTAYILVATSGDTGKAALEGFKDVPQTKISVFYPIDGVSNVQKMQMITQSGNNVHVCAIKGNFDDAQNGVKKIFTDDLIKEELSEAGLFFSSANSINWGRLSPQIAYYVSAYCDLVNDNKIKPGDKVDVCVPTGNFGNILSAYYAKLSGMPIDKLICASNSNNVLTDFIKTGIYDRNRTFHLTMSPSMDILISSNLERLLNLKFGSIVTDRLMKELKETGKYELTADQLDSIKEDFIGYYASEENTEKTVCKYYKKYNYLIDTHTAVAVYCAEQYKKDNIENNKPLIIASTASPYKFAKNVYRSIIGKDTDSDIGAIEALNEYTGIDIPYPLKDIMKKQIRFNNSIEPRKMSEEIINNIKKGL